MEKPEEKSSEARIPQSGPDNVSSEDHEDDDSEGDNDDGMDKAAHEVSIKPVLERDKEEEDAHDDAVGDGEGGGGHLQVHVEDVFLLANWRLKICVGLIVMIFLNTCFVRL